MLITLGGHIYMQKHLKSEHVYLCAHIWLPADR